MLEFNIFHSLCGTLIKRFFSHSGIFLTQLLFYLTPAEGKVFFIPTKYYKIPSRSFLERLNLNFAISKNYKSINLYFAICKNYNICNSKFCNDWKSNINVKYT